MAKMKALVCRECGKEYPTKAMHVCDMCFGPLEVKYNYEEIKKTISRRKIEDGPLSMWRYIDLLPVEGGRPSARTRDSPRWCGPATSLPIWASTNCTSRTTRSITRRSPLKIGSSPWP